MISARPALLAAALALTAPAIALAQALNLPGAVRQAFAQGPDLASSIATLNNARADLASKEADPSTLIVPLTQARNTAQLNQVQLDAKRLEVMSNVTGAYLNLFEAQENIKVLEAQLALDTRNLEVARIRLQARNGTQLDVNRAENVVNTSRQSLADARANLPILSNRLEVLLGVNTGNLTVGAPPAFREVKIDSAALEAGLETRLPSVLQVAQAVQLADLNVKLSDNDFTPPATLRDNKVTLENAQRNLSTIRQTALTQLRDSVRNTANALEGVRLRDRDRDNAEDALAQDQLKFKNGTISRLQLQQTEVSALRARFTYLQATNLYLRALAGLSVAAGVDLTGLVAAR
jgi:outer membrane protein TolC